MVRMIARVPFRPLRSPIMIPIPRLLMMLHAHANCRSAGSLIQGGPAQRASIKVRSKLMGLGQGEAEHLEARAESCMHERTTVPRAHGGLPYDAIVRPGWSQRVGAGRIEQVLRGADTYSYMWTCSLLTGRKEAAVVVDGILWWGADQRIKPWNLRMQMREECGTRCKIRPLFPRGSLQANSTPMSSVETGGRCHQRVSEGCWLSVARWAHDGRYGTWLLSGTKRGARCGAGGLGLADYQSGMVRAEAANGKAWHN
jgi:hypothetical protein